MQQVLAVSNQAYLRTARRYPIALQFPIYRACCLYGNRVHQISKTFPLAAVVGYTPGWRQWLFTAKDKAAEIRQLVQEGARHTSIADALEFPKVARRVSPANINDALWESLRLHPRWFSYMPRTIRKQRRWLNALSLCENTLPGDFSEWVAHHALELGESWAMVLTRIKDWSEWVLACRDKPNEMEFKKLSAEFGILIEKAQALGRTISCRYRDLFSANSGAKFVSREFTTDMSVATVEKLSDEWHEAVSTAEFSRQNITFPAPWYEGGEVDGHTIIPIRSQLDLWREGRAIHNCSATYADQIINSECFFYSVTKGSQREATLMLSYVNGQAVLGDLRSAYNDIVDRKVRAAVKKWLAQNQRLHAIGNWPERPDVKPWEVSASVEFVENDTPECTKPVGVQVQ